MSRFLEKYYKLDKSCNIVDQKKKLLKIEFIKHGLNSNLLNHNNSVQGYLHNNNPSLEQIIKEELIKEEYKCQIYAKIESKLKSKHILLSEYNHICENYQKRNKFLNENVNSIVKEIELEHFYNSKPEYELLCIKYGRNTAKNILLNKYIFTDAESDSSDSSNYHKIKSIKRPVATTVINFN